MSHKSGREPVKEQKGPISMEAQYSQKFFQEPRHTMEDIENNCMRQDMKTMELKSPKV